jgi:hypothetical protein
MTRNARLIRALVASLVWILLHVPMDLILARSQHTDIIAFAITVQVLDVVILSYLYYQLLEHVLYRPWKCVVCDGWGKRMYFPGIGEEKKAQLQICNACQGSGIIWERLAQK